MLYGLESVFGRLEEEKNLLPFPGFEPRVVQPLAIIFHEIGTNTLRKLDARHEDERIWRTFVGGGAAFMRQHRPVSPQCRHRYTTKHISN